MIKRMREARIRQLEGRILFNKIWRVIGFLMLATSVIMLVLLAGIADDETVRTSWLGMRLFQWVVIFGLGVFMARKDYFTR